MTCPVWNARLVFQARNSSSKFPFERCHGGAMPERLIRVVLSPYPRWYVYVPYDPRMVRTGESGQIDHVVYVGKGTRARAWVDASLSSPDHRRWLRDLQNDGFSPDEFVRIE